MTNFKYSVLEMEEWHKPNQVRLMKQVKPAIHESIALYNKKNKQVTVSRVDLLSEEDLDAIENFIRGLMELYG